MDTLTKKYALPRQMQTWLIGLMLVSTVLFTLGILLERTKESSEVAGASNEVQGEHQEEGEAHQEGKGEAAETGETTRAAPETQPETILGIDIENPAFVIGAILVWSALMIGVWWFGGQALIPILVVAAGTLLFDLIEVVMQINRSQMGIALLALLVAGLHAAVVIVVGRMLLNGPAAERPAGA